MLSARNLKLLLAAILLLLLLSSILWLLRQNGGGGARQPQKAGSGSNLALDLRYTYDSAIFRPSTYDGAAEFPLELDGPDFNFYGKRIRGAGKILAKEPGPILYDFVGSQHSEVFEYWYNLKPQGEPQYEDCTLQGRLGLHQKLNYLRTEDSRGWPPYFPESLRGSLQDDGSRSGGSDTAFIEGWTLFSSEDLFFFYAIGPRELSSAEREACIALIDSMQFNAIGANDAGSGAAAEKQGEAEAGPGKDEEEPGREKLEFRLKGRGSPPEDAGGADGSGAEGAPPGKDITD